MHSTFNAGFFLMLRGHRRPGLVALRPAANAFRFRWHDGLIGKKQSGSDPAL
jgi:hypothetical protein